MAIKITKPKTQTVQEEIQEQASMDMPVEEVEAPVKSTKAKSTKKVEQHQAVATVETTHKDGSITSEKEVVAEAPVEGPKATVEVSIGMTKNLGNFESLKFHVTLTVPCLATGEDIEDTYEQAKEWVDNKINEINEEVESL